ncbi:hypothetical protein GCM10009565_55610 [Amycolatopsis albidoflavus]
MVDREDNRGGIKVSEGPWNADPEAVPLSPFSNPVQDDKLLTSRSPPHRFAR